MFCYLWIITILYIDFIKVIIKNQLTLNQLYSIKGITTSRLLPSLKNEEELESCYEAMENCPVEAIGDDGEWYRCFSFVTFQWHCTISTKCFTKSVIQE